MKKLLLFTLLTITPLLNCWGSGYSSYYNNYSGNSYTVRSYGNSDYVSGSNGYYGTGRRIGSSYYYND